MDKTRLCGYNLQKDEISLDKKKHGQPLFNGQDLPLNADDLIIGEENLEQKFRQN